PPPKPNPPPGHPTPAQHAAHKPEPPKPALKDLYAPWGVSSKEMAAYTHNQPQVQEAVDMQRFIQIEVTENTHDQQALLKEYGLFGPPGVFVVRA
ncbi:protein-disulfide reductase DsbD, partial [Neisseria sp. P0017.S004]